MSQGIAGEEEGGLPDKNEIQIPPLYREDRGGRGSWKSVFVYLGRERGCNAGADWLSS